MQRYYDREYERLIYVDNAPTEDFWDAHWQAIDFRKAICATPSTWVTRVTKKYLPAESKILEGGCGVANHVYALSKQGFIPIGLDFAPNTVEKIRKYAPELHIELGDVRDLPFEDNQFDGYWSLGVIEHFWDGYDEIAREMTRVLRPGGYLFLSFPCMSRLRRRKARKSQYPYWNGGDIEPPGFYQFALNPELVKTHMSKLGFKLVYETGLDAVKGIKDEVVYLNTTLQAVYDSKTIAAGIIRRMSNIILSNCSGHSRLLILQKR